MVARIGTLAVGAQFDTLLTGRRGVVRSLRFATVGGLSEVDITLYTSRGPETRWLHPDVRVRVVEVTH